MVLQTLGVRTDGRKNCGREFAARQVVGFAEWWKSWVGGAGTEVLPLSNLFAFHPILRIAALQLAFGIPAAPDAVLEVFMEMSFLVNGLLIFVEPPFETMPFAGVEVAGF